MTERKTNSCRNCIVCIGCGRGAGTGKDLLAVEQLGQAAAGESGRGAFVRDAVTGSAMPYEQDAEMTKDACLIAADIGTTTIVMQLRRVADGAVLGTFHALNPQRKYGLDVLSRIRAAEDAETATARQAAATPDAMPVPDGIGGTDAAAEMKQLVWEVIRRGIAELLQTAQLPVLGMCIAANTTMVHLLMGYSVEGLGKAPFTSNHLEEIHTVFPWKEAEGEEQCNTTHKEGKLLQNGQLETVIVPGFSAFVGGDIYAGLRAYGVGESADAGVGECECECDTDAVTLYLDLGTNGEIVLGNRQKLLATATAAGPAFEGRLAEGVYGADAVHFLAELSRQGLVDETGLLADDYFESGVSIGGTVMTQEDIRSLQLAKAAVCGGIRVLCEEYGLDSFEKIERVYLAGGFGYFLRPKDAVSIGLLPRELEEKCVAVGNAALEGAFIYGRDYFAGGKRSLGGEEAALDANADTAAQMTGTLKLNPQDLKTKTQVYNLAASHTFEQYYIEAINLPQKE